MKIFLFESAKYCFIILISIIYFKIIEFVERKKGTSQNIIIFLTLFIAFIGYIIYCINIVGYENVGSYILKKIFSNIWEKIRAFFKLILAFFFIYLCIDIKNFIKNKSKIFAIFFVMILLPIIGAFIKYGKKHIYFAIDSEIPKIQLFGLVLLFAFFGVITSIMLWFSKKFENKRDFVFLTLLTIKIYILAYFLDVYGLNFVTTKIANFIGVVILVLIALSVFLGSGSKSRSKCSGCPDEYLCTNKFGYHCPNNRF